VSTIKRIVLNLVQDYNPFNFIIVLKNN